MILLRKIRRIKLGKPTKHRSDRKIYAKQRLALIFTADRPMTQREWVIWNLKKHTS